LRALLPGSGRHREAGARWVIPPADRDHRPIELIEGKVVCADGPLAFTPRQAREAAARGVPVWSCVDAVLADDAAVNDLLDRLAA
jgi:hypothetical protein